MTGLLHGRALNRTVGAKDAAISRLWAKQGLTTGAVVKVDAGVGRHDFGARCAALRTGQDGFKNDLRIHGPHLLVEFSRCSSRRPRPGFACSPDKSG